MLFQNVYNDAITRQGMLGALMMGLSEPMVKYAGLFTGLASGILGCFLLILSIIQKQREMKKWKIDNKSEVVSRK